MLMRVPSSLNTYMLLVVILFWKKVWQFLIKLNLQVGI